MHGIARIHRKALLADEQAVDRDLAVSVLQKLNYAAEVASSASDALLCLAREPFSLVLLSNTLPDMPGPEMVRQIRQLEGPARSTAVMVLSAPGVAPMDPIYAPDSVAGFLSRPLEAEQLASLLASLETARTAEEEAIVDIDHLASFTDGDLELEAELSALFLSSAEAYFDQMHRSLQTGSPWKSSVHALKGASANLGARRLAALARAAEHLPPTEPDLRAIRQAIDQVGRFFSARQRARAKSLAH